MNDEETMNETRETVERPADREPWTAPELLVVDVASETEAFNGGAGDSNTGS
ncbi:MAG: hypothetical protein Q7J28_17675 [Caulobacter sp.]|nr:hypothetical protein [Caulobacter sp.]